jgi:NhaA family Na+:H+ antiporter
MPLKMLREFIKFESSAGIILFLSALTAVVLVNSPLHEYYDLILDTKINIEIGALALNKPFLLWINDGLMALFFLYVGLEIKREVIEGQLSSREQITLPLLAAVGGIVFPALIFLYINKENEIYQQGWAISSATDIAFALGLMMLFKKKIHESLKVTLVAIAIIDDLAAILIIAFFYTDNLSLLSLGLAGACILALFLLRFFSVKKTTIYILVGIILWICVLKSGVHATLAGVVVAFFIPLKDEKNNLSPLRDLEHELHSWVTYGILPIFAFANAGISLQGLTFNSLFNSLTLGIILGLIFGKSLGVLLMTAVGSLFKICTLPKQVSILQFIGMSFFTGIGFTMSLFIGTLAFEDVLMQTQIRLGVIVGSLVAGLIGSVFILLSKDKTN